MLTRHLAMSRSHINTLHSKEGEQKSRIQQSTAFESENQGQHCDLTLAISMWSVIDVLYRTVNGLLAKPAHFSLQKMGHVWICIGRAEISKERAVESSQAEPCRGTICASHSSAFPFWFLKAKMGHCSIFSPRRHLGSVFILAIWRLDYSIRLFSVLPLHAFLLFNSPKFSHTIPLLHSHQSLPITTHIQFFPLHFLPNPTQQPALSYQTNHQPSSRIFSNCCSCCNATHSEEI